jgi:pimeloyl-ACP methyl ester carboxylesterase
MPNFEHAGATLHYALAGEGPPLVLIHGFGSSHVDWELQLPALTPHFQVIMPDLRGFGDSSRDTGPFSAEQFAEDLDALLDHLDIERFCLLGYSLGGAVSFEFSVNQPDRIERLILVNTLPSFRPTTLKKKWEVFMRKTVVRMTGIEKMAKVLGKRLFPEADQVQLRETFEMRYARNDKSVYMALLKSLPTWSVRERIGVLKMPILVIGAEFDYTPFSEKEAYVAELDQAELVKVEGSRHGTPFDRPEQFNGLVLEFLQA